MTLNGSPAALTPIPVLSSRPVCDHVKGKPYSRLHVVMSTNKKPLDLRFQFDVDFRLQTSLAAPPLLSLSRSHIHFGILLRTSSAIPWRPAPLYPDQTAHPLRLMGYDIGKSPTTYAQQRSRPRCTNKDEIVYSKRAVPERCCKVQTF